MRLEDADRSLVVPALAICARESGRQMDTIQARVMMLTIALQESRFAHRAQIGGPACGYWQFEQGGGTRGVMTHGATSRLMDAIASDLDYDMSGPIDRRIAVVHGALSDNGLLAACAARALLWTDPHALPDINEPGAAWDLYIRTWRPGKPHRHTWDGLHSQVVTYLGATA